MHERIKQVMADILDLDPNSIDGTTSKDNTASWDSLNHINLTLALEQEFSVSFDVNELEAMLSFDDISEILERKLQG
jgi:acyl carrier protein